MFIRLMVLAAVAVGGCSDWTYGRPLSGRVADVGARFSGGGNGSVQEKIALLVAPTGEVDRTIGEVAGGEGGISIECLSTRCAVLKPGDCVTLDCGLSVRWWEPNVIVCKHRKTVACPERAE